MTGFAGVCVAGALDCGAGVCPAGAGTAGLGAGVSGTGDVGLLICWRIEEPLMPTALSVRKTKASAQTMNMTAHQVVALRQRVRGAARTESRLAAGSAESAGEISGFAALQQHHDNQHQAVQHEETLSEESQPLVESFQPSNDRPKPNSRAMVHFIQLGICIANLQSVRNRLTVNSPAQNPSSSQ